MPDDDEDDSWLDEPQEASYKPAQKLDAESTSSINLASRHLASFLADSPVTDISMTQVPSQSTAESQSTDTQDDNDFSMEF